MRREQYQAGGRIKEEWECIPDKDGKEIRHGVAKIFHQNGQLMEQGLYIYGKKCGKWTAFHNNGIKAEEGLVLDDLDEGIWQYWDETGRLVESGTWKQGKPDGKWFVYLKSGRVLEGAWKDGERWDGECYTNGRYTLHLNGKLIREGMLEDN
jgi:antitoxin component YwqK of YwqJK toxin-antitoxin module